MKKVMTILAVAALSASTAFAGGLDEKTEDATTIVQTPPSGTICTNSIAEAVTCGALAACVGGLCGGGIQAAQAAQAVQVLHQTACELLQHRIKQWAAYGRLFF